MVKKIRSWLILARTTKSIAITSVVALVIVLVAALAACSSAKTPAVNPNQNSTLAQSLEPSAFVISGFAVNPAKVNTGDSVSIIAKVTNSNANNGTYNAVLKINNAIVISKALTIPAGVTQTLNFLVPTNNPGTYEVAFGGLTEIFTVVDDAGNPVKIIPTSDASSSTTTTPAGTAAPSCCSPTQPTPTASSAPSCCGSPGATPSTPTFPRASGGCCGR